ncbi:hypothetical protein [Xenorhabdus budapestensis]|uniref:hypothetical protein n=1 Tax=Xenorhabdus budapestensis TaxID=290110 RepID=UPI00147294F7|nr:hypothetical protein [Xenorhabdus budapestensis]
MPNYIYSAIVELIDLIKTHYTKGKSPKTLKIADDLGLTVPRRLRAYLKRKPEEANLDPYLFEFFIYQKRYHLINRGKLCCNASVSYCDINHDLINDSLVDDIEKIAHVLRVKAGRCDCGTQSSLDIDDRKYSPGAKRWIPDSRNG